MSTATLSKLDVLNAIPETEKEKSGSKSPVVPIDAGMEAKLHEIKELKAAIEDAKGHLNIITASVLTEAEQMRRALCVQEHKHLTSISLAGIVTLIVQNKYSALPVSEESRLRSVFNRAFDESFARVTTLSVDMEKISTETLALLTSEGAVTKSEILKPTAVPHAARSTDPNTAKLCDVAGLLPVTYLK